MAKTLFLLDGMALVYRAHFALIRAPIFNSKGENTSALFGFANTLLDILEKEKPDYIGLAMDTPEPTERHKIFKEYKAQREAIPEDIATALPAIVRLAEALGVKVLKYPGYEADDVIGTLARLAEEAQVETRMVTPDKDFAQLVSERSIIYKPGRQGNQMEVLGVEEICAKWEVERTEQVIDILGLWGDSSDNIPGVPGYGEKTAKKLVGQYGSIENLIEHAGELKGKQKERILEHKEQALLSKKLATIDRFVPVMESLDDLQLSDRNDEKLKELLVTYEFNTLGRRLYGEDFKAGRGYGDGQGEGETAANLKTHADVKHTYTKVSTLAEVKDLVTRLDKQSAFCFDVETDGLDPKLARLLGVAFSWSAHKAFYVVIPVDEALRADFLQQLRGPLEDPAKVKVGHHLKFDISVMAWQDIRVKGPLFDTMVAHFLVEPERRHNMDALAEQYLGYTPIPITSLIGEKKSEQLSLVEVDEEKVAEYAAEDADVTWQLKEYLEPLLEEQKQHRVFYDIEAPLIPVLSHMEQEGVALDLEALKSFSAELGKRIETLATRIFEISDCDFNLKSPKQLGEVLFDKLQLVEKPKKTKTGMYATNEQVLVGLAPKHEIIRLILDYREATKLKSTYVDTLPGEISSRSGRVHTSYSQTGAITGRLASSNPNLQNIPIRTDLGQHIRRAFIPRSPDRLLLAADYSQIELRVMAEMSGDEGLKEAFLQGQDIHTATAAKVYGLSLEDVEPSMRRAAKMVNFGIMFGISAFGLSQRLGISRTEAAAIIDQYFLEYPLVRKYMDDTIAFCRDHGYVETMTGRRRQIRDINSANGTTRAGAERTAINSPIQGTAADLIKLAMIRIHKKLLDEKYQTRMIMQVHDELVFDLVPSEEDAVRSLVEKAMVTALSMSIPIAVEIGVGKTWLDAH